MGFFKFSSSGFPGSQDKRAGIRTSRFVSVILNPFFIHILLVNTTNYQFDYRQNMKSIGVNHK